MYEARYVAKPDFDRFPGYPIAIGHIFEETGHLVNGTLYPPLMYNLHLVVRGRGWLKTENETLELLPGTGFLCSPHQVQRFGSDSREPWEVWWILFGGEGLQAMFGDKSMGDVWVFSFEEHERLEGLIRELWRLAGLSSVPSVPKKAALLYEIIAEVMLGAGDLNAPSTRSLEQNMRRTAEYMRTNCSKRLPLGKLAAFSGLSPAYFSRSFHEAMGVPPLVYLNEQRIELSKQMLITTTKPVKQIALEAGFAKPSYFIERFRLAAGMTPTAYRAGFTGGNAEV
ncbi:AraC family transcriptional regulator [Paenibacillus sacheonensis]|uniref:Helix-turn-helix domain-containing protein n=1 Tax=Paenibacillus sacheonensis TaxID=742054 RepID=A0A7X4YSW3_9BACL|nr:AraC family transcriptional regulator [Paenibacillus sacheonensis]MBM7567141.1 AraC-like DNA-binding protein [Paenibacillus sacheonensis]NBC70934.1 helix-turn-helix domain-containing protein [Paenibacillus sacheonensis]